MYELIFNSIYNGAMVTDADGFITHFNKPYGRFLGMNPEEQIGKYCLDAIENSRMHIVAKTGRPEINMSHLIMGQNMVAATKSLETYARHGARFAYRPTGVEDCIPIRSGP